MTLHTNTTTLRHFFTLRLSILTFPAFSTPANWSGIFMSLNFHPCKLVPQIHVSHFQSPRSSAMGWRAIELRCSALATARSCISLFWQKSDDQEGSFTHYFRIYAIRAFILHTWQLKQSKQRSKSHILVKWYNSHCLSKKTHVGYHTVPV